MATPTLTNDRSTRLASLVQALVVGVGVVLVVATVAFGLTIREQPVAEVLLMASFSAAMGVVLVLFGLRARPALSLRRWDIGVLLGWLGVGVASQLVIGVWFVFLNRAVRQTYQPAYSLLIALTFGVAAGVFVGVYSNHRRSAADAISDEYQQLSFLNRLMRHNVLNDLNIIMGETQVHAERCDGVRHESLADIQEVSDESVALINDVRAIIEASDESDRSLTTQSLATAIDGAVSAARDRFEIEVDGERTDARVRASQHLDTAFEGILSTGAMTDGTDGRFALSVEKNGGTVTVSVCGFDDAVLATWEDVRGRFRTTSRRCSCRYFSPTRSSPDPTEPFASIAKPVVFAWRYGGPIDR